MKRTASWAPTALLTGAICAVALSAEVPEGPVTESEQSPTAKEWPWPESLDAVAAAPESHEILLENDSVRVVRVYIPAGVREPVHTHRWPSVMIVDRPTRIRYYLADGRVAFETPADFDRTPGDPSWLGPEGPHSVENIDTEDYYAYRVELKGTPAP